MEQFEETLPFSTKKSYKSSRRLLKVTLTKSWFPWQLQNHLMHHYEHAEVAKSKLRYDISSPCLCGGHAQTTSHRNSSDVCVCFARVAKLNWFELNWIDWRWLNSVLSSLYVLKKSLYAVWYKCEASNSQPCISQYCRPCTLNLFFDREMLRWYITASKLTAFNQSLVHQDLSGPLPIWSARYRVNFNNINSLHTSCFFILNFDIYNLWSLLLVVVVLTFSPLRFKQAPNKFHFSNFFSNARFWFSSHI